MNEPVDSRLLRYTVWELPVFIIEHNGQRHSISPNALSQKGQFWMIDCASFQFAERLISETPGQLSLSALFKSLHLHNIPLPSEPILCSSDFKSVIDETVFENKEVDTIIVYPKQRRIDTCWVECQEKPRWIDIKNRIDDPMISNFLMRYIGDMEDTQIIREFRGGIMRISSGPMEQHVKMLIGQGDIKIEGVSNVIGIKSLNNIFIFPDTRIAKYFMSLSEVIDKNMNTEIAAFIMSLQIILKQIILRKLLNRPIEQNKNIDELIYRPIQRMVQENQILEKYVDMTEIYSIFETTDWKLFDLGVWRRNDIEGLYSPFPVGR